MKKYEDSTIVIYKRVSSEDQAVDGASLEAQEGNARREAEKRGITGQFVVFSDPGVSATKVPMEKRHGLMECLDYIRKHKADYLFVWKRDRLARVGEELLWIEKTVIKNKTKIIFFGRDEPPIGTGGYGIFQESILASLTELECAVLRQRIIDTNRNLVLNGKYVHNRPPFGYSYVVEEKSYQVNPDEAAIVKEIYYLYLQKGYGAYRIAKHLTNNGNRTRSNTYWYTNTILNVLRNPFYTGTQRLSYLDNKNGEEERVNILQRCDKIEPLISPEEFDAVQEIMRSRQKNHEPPRVNTTSFLFSGLILCKNCGCKYTTNTWTEKKTRKDGSVRETRTSAYCCRGINHGLDCLGRVKKERIEDAVVKGILEELSNLNMDEVFSLAKSELERQTYLQQSKVHALEADIKRIDNKIERNQANIEDCVSPRMRLQYESRIEALLLERDVKYTNLLQAQDELSIFQSTCMDKILAYQRIVSWENLFSESSDQDRRILIRDVVEKIVYCYKTKTAEVTLKLDRKLIVKNCDLSESGVPQCYKDHGIAQISFLVKVA